MLSPVSLSFVIPAHNEEDFIENTLDTLNSAVANELPTYEIVVVNDGSRDKTLLNVTRYAEKNGHVKIISFDRNMGKGFAVKAGFMQASGNVVVFADGDMEIDLRTVSNFVKALEHGDIVIASKWHPDSHVEVPLVRKILSHSFNVLVRILTGASLRDTQAGLKAMRKSAFVDIFPRLAVKRYAFDVELLAVARLFGLKVIEMPVNIKLDASFKFKQIWLMFIDLLGIAYRLKVCHWYQRDIHIKDRLQSLASIILGED